MLTKHFKSIIGFVLLLVLLLSISSIRAMAVGANSLEPDTYQVISETLAVHKEPYTATMELDTLNSGDTCSVYEITIGADGSFWGRTSIQGITGWIDLSSCYLIAEGATDEDWDLDTDQGTGSTGSIGITGTTGGTVSASASGYQFIAHRGSHTGGLADNSLQSFTKAGEEGFWGIETDVRKYNGVFVCSHGTAGSSCPSIADYLSICKQYGCVAILDIKSGLKDYKTALPELVELVKQSGMIDRAVFQCGMMIHANVIRKYSSEARIWILAANETGYSTALQDALSVNAECINIDHTLVADNDYLAQIKNSGIKTCYYVIGSKKAIRALPDATPDYLMVQKPL